MLFNSPPQQDNVTYYSMKTAQEWLTRPPTPPKSQFSQTCLSNSSQWRSMITSHSAQRTCYQHPGDIHITYISHVCHVFTVCFDHESQVLNALWPPQMLNQV